MPSRPAAILRSVLDRGVLFGRRVSGYTGFVPPARAVRFAYLDFRGGEPEEQLVWPGYGAPFTVRAGTSDVRTFGHVIAGDGYDQPGLPEPRVIVDAGAHIGLATVWYANRFPRARVIALEPEARNFALLQRNTAPYPNVEAVRAALWTETGTIALTDPRQGSWAFRVDGAGRGGAEAPRIDDVPCIDVDTLMAERGIDRIDIFKVDIEGAEKAVFERSDSWIDKVDAIAIELHDRFQPGCARAFFRATADFVDDAARGEDTFVRRARPGPPPGR